MQTYLTSLIAAIDIIGIKNSLEFDFIFRAEFLTPLEEDDRRFELKVRHTGVKDYMDQLLSGSHREDLDDVTPQMVCRPIKI